MNFTNINPETINPDTNKEKENINQREIWLVDDYEEEADDLKDILENILEKESISNTSIQVFNAGGNSSRSF